MDNQEDLSYPWDSDEAREKSATLNANVFLGFGAQIIGPAVIGSFVYISAGATVTRDIPDKSFVHGYNCIKPLAETSIKF